MAATSKDLELTAIALRSNAVQLAQAARHLLDGGYWPQAFALAEIAHEELGKISMVLGEAIRIACGLPRDRGLLARMRSHQRKVSVASLRPVADRAASMPDRLDALLADKAGRLAANKSSSGAPERKNKALYVDLRKQTISEPMNEISQAEATAKLQLVDELLRTLTLPNPGKADELARKPEFRVHVDRLESQIAVLPDPVPY